MKRRGRLYDKKGMEKAPAHGETSGAMAVCSSRVSHSLGIYSGGMVCVQMKRASIGSAIPDAQITIILAYIISGKKRKVK